MTIFFGRIFREKAPRKEKKNNPRLARNGLARSDNVLRNCREYLCSHYKHLTPFCTAVRNLFALRVFPTKKAEANAKQNMKKINTKKPKNTSTFAVYLDAIRVRRFAIFSRLSIFRVKVRVNFYRPANVFRRHNLAEKMRSFSWNFAQIFHYIYTEGRENENAEAENQSTGNFAAFKTEDDRLARCT